MVACTNEMARRSGGCTTGTGMASAGENRRGTEDWQEAQKCLRERLQARDNNTLPAIRRGRANSRLGNGRIFTWRTSPSRPFRAPKTHAVNERALKHLRAMFETTKLADLTADDIETYLRRRLKAAGAWSRRRTESSRKES